MDIVLGVSMAPETVRLVVIEGQSADGVTVEQDEFAVAGGAGSVTAGAVDQVLAAIGGTREGALAGGYRLVSTGVTWTDPAGVGALRDAMGRHGMGNVMLVSPLLAAAALAQTVGSALDYAHIAMLFVEPETATLAVVDVSDGSIVDLHRQQLAYAPQEPLAVELATMVAGLNSRGGRADGVFLVGCGTDIVAVKPALEAATPLEVTAPEEPEMALARGAALASANAPLFASSTAALAYALDPGTGEVSPRPIGPTYLDVWGNTTADALAYSAVADEDDVTPRRRRPMFLAGSALAGIAAVVAGVVLFSLASDRPGSTAPQNPRVSVATPAKQVPAAPPSAAPAAQPPAPAPPPPPPPGVAAPQPAPPVAEQPAPQTQKPPPAAPVYRAPSRPAPQYTPPPAQRPAPAPAPAAPPPPPPAAPAQPPVTMYLHFPFVTVPIPITPPAPPPPPAP
ncbi:hypothetical protein A5756_04835 [Mycobacterium sp. 852002-53434_SCH5985345]|uniref:DUF7159 family protein n=1 Tax=Mycobacterium sp. 852002-53434_SCH5985345 TaxID=1834107 RepID=UPI0007FD36FB|nr:hypothetical protein [Mycobacterium sp. 852002-53434_SCH5985345]OBF59789.1 hypothetical protein A5756_04835 [Mycobacterium sp. 852002-53434_SCH5985345]